MEKKSTIHGTSVSYEDSTHENNSRENMYTRHKRSTFMVNKDSAHQQHMYYYDLSIFMINKDGSFSTNMSYYGFPRVVFNEPNQKAKWLKIRLSIPAESKRAEKNA